VANFFFREVTAALPEDLGHMKLAVRIYEKRMKELQAFTGLYLHGQMGDLHRTLFYILSTLCPLIAVASFFLFNKTLLKELCF
jgi:hypothetical protein